VAGQSTGKLEANDNQRLDNQPAPAGSEGGVMKPITISELVETWDIDQLREMIESPLENWQ